MKIDYVKVGDYLIPALTVPDKRYNIGKYGMLRRTFLQEHHNAIYSVMMINGTLLQHLEDVNKLCCDELDRLIPAMAKNEGITEAAYCTERNPILQRFTVAPQLLCSNREKIKGNSYRFND